MKLGKWCVEVGKFGLETGNLGLKMVCACWILPKWWRMMVD